MTAWKTLGWVLWLMAVSAFFAGFGYGLGPVT